MRITKRLAACVCVLAVFNWGPRLEAAGVIQFSAAIYDGTEGSGSAEIVVLRTNDLDVVVSVDFATTNLSATPELDYLNVATNLTFGVGETNQTVAVPILNDSSVEGIETFQASLINPTGGAVLGARTNAIVRITDNDKGLTFELADYSAPEDGDSVSIGVLRGDDGDFPITVEVSTTDVTAQVGLDYTGTTNTLSFTAGEKLKLVTVPILNDGLKEANETFRLTFSNLTGGAVLGTLRTATVTIYDNDPGVQFEHNKYWIRENEGLLTMEVRRGNDVDLQQFTVDYATSNLTAVAGEDYVETKGTLEFAAGELAKTFAVPILWNQTSELDRQFKLTLGIPSGGVASGTNRAAATTVLDMTGMEAHRFDGVAVLPDRSVQLTLGGGVHSRFRDYYDLYPLEVSANLTDWTPLVTLQRTNSSTNALVYTDPAGATASQRFYRTVTNHLITAMLKPTGSRTVGMVNRWLTDPTRTNRFGIPTNSSFMVQIWYPAKPEPGRLPVSYEDGARLCDPVWVGAFLDREPYFVSHAVVGSPCASDGGPCPIVLLSHGLGAYRYQMAEKAENLASHGYIFVGVDHFDAAGPAFPDGTVGSVPTPTMTTAGLQDRVRDLSFVLDELARWNSGDTMFAGRFDLGRVAVMGFSWGGYTAAEFCRVDPRCQAAIPLDPGGASGSLLVTGLQKPFLEIHASNNSDTSLFDKAAKDAIWFQISLIEHGNFDDFYWWSYPSSLASAREATRTINTYTLWFLDKYLQGSTDPMPALAGYPRIFNFKQK